MKQTERASIFRVVSDLIKADAIIDTREMEKLDSIREKYAIKKEDEILGSSYTLSKAVHILLDSPKCLQHELVATFNEVAMSDCFCAREEALLLVALRLSCKRIRDAAFFLIIMLFTFAATLLKSQKYVSSRTIQKCVEHVSTST